MPTPTLDQDIQSRIQSFLAELSQLVKMAALGSVHAALGGELEPSMRSGPGRPRGSGKRGPGRPRKAGRPARAGKRAKRSSEAVAAMAARVLAQIRSKQGQRLEEIGRAMKLPTGGLKLPIQKLLAEKKLRTEGQKRGTMYFAGGSRGASKSPRKAKTQRRRKVKSARKAKAVRKAPRKKAARRAKRVVVRPVRSRRTRPSRKPSRPARPSRVRAVTNELAMQAAAISTALP